MWISICQQNVLVLDPRISSVCSSLPQSTLPLLLWFSLSLCTNRSASTRGSTIYGRDYLVSMEHVCRIQAFVFKEIQRPLKWSPLSWWEWMNQASLVGSGLRASPWAFIGAPWFWALMLLALDCILRSSLKLSSSAWQTGGGRLT